MESTSEILCLLLSLIVVVTYCGPLKPRELKVQLEYSEHALLEFEDGKLFYENEIIDEAIIAPNEAEMYNRKSFNENKKHEAMSKKELNEMSLRQQVSELRRIVKNTPDSILYSNRGTPLSSVGYLNPRDSSIINFIWDKVKGAIFVLTCDGCKIFVMLMQELVGEKKSRSEIVKEVTEVCIALHIEDNTICTQVTREFQGEVITVFEHLVLSPTEACGLLVGDSCAKTYDPEMNWNVTFPNVPKPPVKPLPEPQEDNPKLRILQLSDIHLDFQYKPGSNADCGEPVCCRTGDGPPKNASGAAGYWGDYRYCDTTTWLLEALFKHLQENETFDLVYWTGDLPGHNVWHQSRADQIHVQDYVNGLMMKYFPGKMVLPSVGNHESAPVNSFPPPFVTGNQSISWLYDVLTDNWTHWIPNDTIPTMKKGSYYTVLLKPGFRIISVNMNYCNNQNWWLLLNMTDPADELQWLISILQYAENNHEKVHIIGHIPPGTSGCVKHWSWNYYKIINRYESTIRAQFYGHTHHDHYFLFYDEKTNFTRPTNIGYIGPSVTPYQMMNPGYRIYTVDGFYSNSTFTVLDHSTYYVNLTEANKSKKSPTWLYEYSAKEEYGMKTLFPKDWDQLIYRMLKNDTLFTKYYRYYSKMYPYDTDWDNRTRNGMLCDIRTGRSSDPNLCRDIVPPSQYEQLTLWRQKGVKC